MRTVERYLGITSLAFLLVIFAAQKLLGSEEEAKLRGVSVTVHTPHGIGSGTLFVKDDKIYVISCGHVAEGLRTVNKYTTTDKEGVTKEIEKVSWEDGKIIIDEYQDNKHVAEHHYKAKVIAYSPSDEEGGLDLAVLEIYKKKLMLKGADFIVKDAELEIGDDVAHVGSLYGDLTGSLVKGTISRFDYKIKGNSFTAANLGSKPGSSGGGIFVKKNGKFVFCGILVRGDGTGVALLKPSSVIRDWLKSEKLEFLIK